MEQKPIPLPSLWPAALASALGGIDEAYNLMIRDYAVDSSAEEARAIRRRFHETANTELRSAESVGQILGYSDGRGEDASMEPLGLRTLSRVHVVNDEIAARIVDAYDNLQQLLHVAENDTSSHYSDLPHILRRLLASAPGFSTPRDLRLDVSFSATWSSCCKLS